LLEATDRLILHLLAPRKRKTYVLNEFYLVRMVRKMRRGFNRPTDFGP